MAAPIVLCYNLGPERTARIRTLCMIQKLHLRPVEQQEFAEPVGALVGILPVSGVPMPENPFTDEMLVLCGFSEPALQSFLQGFHKSGIPPVALKAVLTPSNVQWDSQQLWEELRREHTAMTGSQP